VIRALSIHKDMKLKDLNRLPIVIIVSLCFLSTLAVPLQAGDKKTVFSLRDWMAKDDDFKHKLVKAYINAANEDNVKMRLSVDYYVKEIDLLIQQSIKNGEQAGLDNSFGIALKTIAIMEGDFDNGKNKLELAKEFMGPIVFEDFMKRHPDKYKKLRQDSEGNK